MNVEKLRAKLKTELKVDIIQPMADARIKHTYLPSGIADLDLKLGGGWPIGRLNVLYGAQSSGKSIIALLTIANAQKFCIKCCTPFDEKTKCACKKCQGCKTLYVDAENYWTNEWATAIGIKEEDVFLAHPRHLEEAFDIVDIFLREEAVDVIVFDSIAGLSPKGEKEGTMEEWQTGLIPRVYTKFLRKWGSDLKELEAEGRKLPMTLIINQIRKKVGVMYGCFSYQSPVLLADGTFKLIGEIVNARMPVDVMAWNSKTGVFEPKRVIRWFKQGDDVDKFSLSDNAVGAVSQEYRTLIAHYPDGSGRTRVTATPNHMIATPNGFVPMGEIGLGDSILCRHEKVVLGSALHDLVVGSMLGDGSLRISGEYTAYFRESHAQEQRDYVLWKRDCFGDLARASGPDSDTEDRSEVGFESISNSAFFDYKALFYSDGGRYKSLVSAGVLELIRRISPLSLAIWYQDDGSLADEHGTRKRNVIALHRTSPAERAMLKEAFSARGFSVAVCAIGPATQIQFNGDQAVKFEAEISAYVHPSLTYKLRHKDDAGRALSDIRFGFRTEVVAFSCSVFEVRQSVKQGHDAVRYNLGVADDATYVVGKTVVHNSPEIMPGGDAQYFAATTIVRATKKGIEMSHDKADPQPMYQTIRFKVEKSKASPVHREGVFEVAINKYLDKDGKLHNIGDIDNVNVLMTYVERFELLTGKSGEYVLAEKPFKTKEEIELALKDDVKFRWAVHKLVEKAYGDYVPSAVVLKKRKLDEAESEEEAAPAAP